MFYRLVFFINIISISLISNSTFSPLPQISSYDKKVVELGRKLFFDPILSVDNTISCASCHSTYGADDVQFSLGVNNALGKINTPSIFNSQFNFAMFWNGRSKDYKEQILDGPITNKHEMASNKKIIEERLNQSVSYKKLFLNSYGKPPLYELVLDAIIKFEKTLITPNSKFDRYLRKELILEKNEKEGLELFVSYGCTSCHNGINIGGNSYQKFGTVVNYEEGNAVKWEDRFQLTKKYSDKNVFRVPSLRNVAKTSPYFHSGTISRLDDAIRIMAYYNLGFILKEDEVLKIKAFLNTLTGEMPKTWKSNGKEL